MIGRERGKKQLVPNSVQTQPERENSKKKIAKKFKKLKKVNSGIISIQNGLRMAEKEKKKILVPNFVHTRPGLENSENNSKKNQKIKKLNSGIISIQKGLREAEKETKKF